MPTLDSLLVNLTPSFPAFFKLLFIAFWVSGMISVIWGINHLRTATDPHSRGHVSPVTGSSVSILIGGILCYLPTMLQSVALTVYGNQGSPVGLMDYQTPADSAGNTYLALRTFLQLVGVYFFGSGWLILRHVGIHGESQRGSFRSGTVKVFSGIALVHIVDTLKLLAGWFGLSVISQMLQNFGG